MRIRDMIAFFDGQMRAIEKDVSPSIAFDVLSIKNINRESKVEAAIKYYCSVKEWPENMDADVRFELYLRLACARWYCDRPEFESVSDEAEDISFEVEESLINYWNDVGRKDFVYDIADKY